MPSSEWILREMTTVNQHDQEQQEQLRRILINGYLLCGLFKVPRIAPSLLQHVLHTSEELGIIQDVLDNNGSACIRAAAANRLPAESVKLLLEYCHKHANIKTMLEAADCHGWNCIMIASAYRLSFDSLKLLLEYCLKHADIETVLESDNNRGWNCIMLAAANKLPFDSFKLLLEYCLQHADIKKMLEAADNITGHNCIMIAYCKRHMHHQPVDSEVFFKLLISYFPCNDCFRSVLLHAESHDHWNEALDSRTRSLLQDPQCWQKCRDWLARRNRQQDEDGSHQAKREAPARRPRE